jgi:DNA-binding winged helix-turn-helix (wHTH) protein
MGAMTLLDTISNKSARTQKAHIGSVAALIPIELRAVVTTAVTSLGAVVTYDEQPSAEAETLIVEVSSANVKRHQNLTHFLHGKTAGNNVGLASWNTVRSGQLELIEGIDDLILYPIDSADLKYRLQRHVGNKNPDISDNGALMHFGDLSLNMQLSKLNIGEKTIAFTGKEFALLLYLARQNERAVDHVELGSEALKIPQNYPTIVNTVNVHVARIRAKLREHSFGSLLVTVKSAGFVLKQKLS